jgi:hypothetical protein
VLADDIADGEGRIVKECKNRITPLNLACLAFDPENPRLPTGTGQAGVEAVLLHMLRDENLIELMGSIAQNGFFPSEPLLVAPQKNSDGYIVVEGNRRLAALFLLQNPDLAPIRKQAVNEVAQGKIDFSEEIPTIIHKSRDCVLDYLGYRHITGVKSWGALEKARYLQQLYDRHNHGRDERETLRVLAKMIGSRSDYVGKLLLSYALYTYADNHAFFNIDIMERDINFSFLYTALGFANIYRFIGLDSATRIDVGGLQHEQYKFLFERLYDPRLKISESREIKSLSAVLGNKAAVEAYARGAMLSDALYFTSEIEETFNRFLVDARNALRQAKDMIEKLPDDLAERDYYVEEFDIISKTGRTISAALRHPQED